jgi:hypothetical protein
MNIIDVQMIILIRATNTSFKGHDVLIVVSHTNMSPLFYAAFRDRDLMNDLGRFAALYNLVLKMTYMPRSLLHLLLTYQMTFKPKELVVACVRNAI